VVVSVSTVVDVPRSAIWAELERIEDHVQWMRDATAIRFVGDGRSGVGTTFECDTKAGQIRLTDVMQITDGEAGSRMAVTHQGLVGGSGLFYLEDGPGSATTIGGRSGSGARGGEEGRFGRGWHGRSLQSSGEAI